MLDKKAGLALPSLRRVVSIALPLLGIFLFVTTTSTYGIVVGSWFAGLSQILSAPQPESAPVMVGVTPTTTTTSTTAEAIRLHAPSRRTSLRSWNSSHIANLYVEPVLPTIQPIPPGQWENVAIPSKSYFAGFEAPNDALRWNQALLQAARGEQILLERVLQVIHTPTDLFENDKHFRWVHRMADLHKSATKEDGWLTNLGPFMHPRHQQRGSRAPIVMLGYRKFEHENHEGPLTGIPSLGPGEIIKKGTLTVPRKIVAVGNVDENWGWASSYYLNRTVPWAMSFTDNDRPFSSNFQYPQEQIQKLVLDNENIVALIVSQHHNISHPKVISLPLGLESNMAREVYASMMKAGQRGLKKEILLYSAGSNYAFRPAIRECIGRNFPKNDEKTFFASGVKADKETYRQRLTQSYASVAMPGLGYDTYRLWETLASGSMPVVERGFGMDRTLYRLPVLLLDDYALLTPELLRQAYVEALYRADQWEFERMTRRWWERLINDISFSSSIEPLLHLHPMSAEDAGFTRPLVPFDCEKMGGCGPGTKRVPKKSCAIDFSLINEKYNYRWKHE